MKCSFLNWIFALYNQTHAKIILVALNRFSRKKMLTPHNEFTGTYFINVTFRSQWQFPCSVFLLLGELYLLPSYSHTQDFIWGFKRALKLYTTSSFFETVPTIFIPSFGERHALSRHEMVSMKLALINTRPATSLPLSREFYVFKIQAALFLSNRSMTLLIS